MCPLQQILPKRFLKQQKTKQKTNKNKQKQKHKTKQQINKTTHTHAHTHTPKTKTSSTLKNITVHMLLYTKQWYIILLQNNSSRDSLSIQTWSLSYFGCYATTIEQNNDFLIWVFDIPKCSIKQATVWRETFSKGPPNICYIVSAEISFF